MADLLNLLRTYSERSHEGYAKAGAIAEETLAAMPTVNAERPAIDDYGRRIDDVEAENLQIFRRAVLIQGTFTGSIFVMYAIGLWSGSYQVAHGGGDVAPSTIFQAFFGVALGTMALGQITSTAAVVAEACGTAAELFEILDTAPTIHLDAPARRSASRLWSSSSTRPTVSVTSRSSNSSDRHASCRRRVTGPSALPVSALLTRVGRRSRSCGGATVAVVIHFSPFFRTVI